MTEAKLWSRRAFWQAAAVAPLAGALFARRSTASDRRPVRSLFEMRQDKLVLQQFDLSCGAAVLATILTYQYDDAVSERKIALSLMTRKEYIENPMVVNARLGFSLFDLKAYVQNRSYTASGFGNMTITDLIELAPIIVPVDFSGYKHFVVFRGFHKGRVLVGDPAWGNRTMKVDLYEKAWLVYGELGQIGLTVDRPNSQRTPNQLAATPRDFLLYS